MIKRRAYICEHKDHSGPGNVPWRTFLTPDEPDRVPNCPDGHGAMRRQTNLPYNRKAKAAAAAALRRAKVEAL